MTFNLDLEHTLDAGLPGDHRVQVWSRSSHLPGRRSNFHANTKVPISCDLWPWPWANPGCKLTWSPSCESLVAIQPFVCEKRFAQKVTDRRTDDGRLAIALAYSWNELKNHFKTQTFMQIRRCMALRISHLLAKLFNTYEQSAVPVSSLHAKHTVSK